MSADASSMFDEFKCHKCGAETATAPYLPQRSVCEACCEDHDYRYERGIGHRCTHCDAEPPPEWFDVD